MAASKDFAAHPRHAAATAAVLLATLAATPPLEAATALQEILISGGTVVTSEGRFDADVRVRDGTIVEIGTGLAAGAGARDDRCHRAAGHAGRGGSARPPGGTHARRLPHRVAGGARGRHHHHLELRLPGRGADARPGDRARGGAHPGAGDRGRHPARGHQRPRDPGRPGDHPGRRNRPDQHQDLHGADPVRRRRCPTTWRPWTRPGAPAC